MEQKNLSELLTGMMQSFQPMLAKELAAMLTKFKADVISEYIAEHPVTATPATEPKAEPKPAKGKGKKKYGADAIRHHEYAKIVCALKKGKNVFLNGPAGTGKSQLADMIADDLGLPFYLSSQVSQEYKIEGYSDAHGVFHTTAFIEAFTKGGIFVFEEIDASPNDVLVVVNTALANKYMDLNGERIYAHKDFRVIATGNTCGTGADSVYVGRNPLDGSTLDRFIFLTIGYDERIEMQCACGDRLLVDFIHELRNAIKKTGCQINFPLSYRGIKDFMDFKDEPCYGLVGTMNATIVKGLDADNIKVIGRQLECYNKYAQAFRQCGLQLQEAA